MSLVRVPCPVCGPGVREVPVWEKNRYRYVRCARCGLIYINPQLTDESVARIYSGQLYDQKSDRLDLLLPRLGRYKSRLLKQFEQFRRTGQLLDVGCFKGFFLYSAARRGWTATGTEVSRPAVEFARRQLGLNVEQGDLLELEQFGSGRWDVITLFDVIEHLSHPDRYIQRAHRLLRPGGLLYLETPNVRALPRYLLGRRWTIFHRLHRYYFQPGTIEKLLRRAGFERIRIATAGFLPLGTRRDEPGYPVSPGGRPGSARSTSGRRLLEHVPIDLIRSVKDAVETMLFVPLDRAGWRIGTKMIVWAEKGD
jgi:2-polyprenyl-3-methyl-5-hydroxy-6-metoxy-1,4-benzoquinol methylase